MSNSFSKWTQTGGDKSWDRSTWSLLLQPCSVGVFFLLKGSFFFLPQLQVFTDSGTHSVDSSLPYDMKCLYLPVVVFDAVKINLNLTENESMLA